MSRCLLDVNVLIALLDSEHLHHEVANDWFAGNAAAGWASCPITQNGAVRILGHPRYAGVPGTVSEIAAVVAGLCARDDHRYWPDDVSIFDARSVDPTRLGSHASLTDVYLLALAVANDGRLATFDRRLAVSAVIGGAGRVEVIG